MKSLSSPPDAFVIIGTLFDLAVLRIRTSVSDEVADVEVVRVDVVVEVGVVDVVVDKVVVVLVVDVVVVAVVVVVETEVVLGAVVGQT